MKSCVIEMVRSVERKLPGGETEILAAKQRYILDEAEAKRYLEPTTELQEINGAVTEVEVEPAATLVREFDVEEEAEAAASAEPAAEAEELVEPAPFATDGE